MKISSRELVRRVTGATTGLGLVAVMAAGCVRQVGDPEPAPSGLVVTVEAGSAIYPRPEPENPCGEVTQTVDLPAEQTVSHQEGFRGIVLNLAGVDADLVPRASDECVGSDILWVPYKIGAFPPDGPMQP